MLGRTWDFAFSIYIYIHMDTQYHYTSIPLLKKEDNPPTTPLTKNILEPILETATSEDVEFLTIDTTLR